MFPLRGITFFSKTLWRPIIVVLKPKMFFFCLKWDFNFSKLLDSSLIFFFLPPLYSFLAYILCNFYETRAANGFRHAHVFQVGHGALPWASVMMYN